MKYEQITAISGLTIITASGAKRAIGNARHQVGDWVYTDGPNVFGHERQSSRTTYIPQEVYYRFDYLHNYSGTAIYRVSVYADVACTQYIGSADNVPVPSSIPLHPYNNGEWGIYGPYVSTDFKSVSIVQARFIGTDGKFHEKIDIFTVINNQLITNVIAPGSGKLIKFCHMDNDYNVYWAELNSAIVESDGNAMVNVRLHKTNIMTNADSTVVSIPTITLPDFPASSSIRDVGHFSSGLVYNDYETYWYYESNGDKYNLTLINVIDSTLYYYEVQNPIDANGEWILDNRVVDVLFGFEDNTPRVQVMLGMQRKLQFTWPTEPYRYTKLYEYIPGSGEQQRRGLSTGLQEGRTASVLVNGVKKPGLETTFDVLTLTDTGGAGGWSIASTLGDTDSYRPILPSGAMQVFNEMVFLFNGRYTYTDNPFTTGISSWQLDVYKPSDHTDVDFDLLLSIVQPNKLPLKKRRGMERSLLNVGG